MLPKLPQARPWAALSPISRTISKLPLKQKHVSSLFDIFLLFLIGLKTDIYALHQ